MPYSVRFSDKKKAEKANQRHGLSFPARIPASAWEKKIKLNIELDGHADLTIILGDSAGYFFYRFSRYSNILFSLS